MKEIIVFGVGGNCIDILDAILELNTHARAPVYRVLGFLDDREAVWHQEFAGHMVLGPLSEAGKHPGCMFVNGIGSVRNFWKRPQIIASTGLSLDRFETIIHPRACVSRLASIGRGTVVMQNATVTAQATLGNHVTVLPNAVISHDAVIGDYTCIASGACAAGGVQVGTACYLGAGCAVNNGVKIGDSSLIGMGAVVLKDVAAGSVVVGNPARVIRKIC